ncbi:MAG: DUF3080 family protein [Pseudomonadales bacterium]|nr:DUF3080 family protein [Pseudomonadales bacterium]
MPASLHHPSHQISARGHSIWRGGPMGLAILLFGMGLAACSPSPWDQAQTRYTEGLARTLDVPLPPDNARATKAPVAPQRVSQQAVAKATLKPYSEGTRTGTTNDPASLNLLDYLRTSPCELHSLISEHNSSLGKLGSATTRLVYDVNFINASDRCVSRLSASHPELAGQLQREADRKRSQLPVQLRTALLYGPEFTQFWQAQSSLGQYPETLHSDLEPALKVLLHDTTAISAVTFSGTASDLDLALAALRSAEGGLLLKGWLDVARQMQVANSVIDRFLAKRPLCYANQSNPRALQLRALVDNVYVGQLQPMTAALNRRTHALLPLIEALESAVDAQQDPRYAAFITARADLIGMARARLVSHTERLQGLLAQCQLAPGQA